MKNNLKNIFKSPFKEISNSKKAYDDLNLGKEISIDMYSDRYTYENKEDNKYDKKWKPQTPLEKETLSPKGYYRQGEREAEKNSKMAGIFASALNKAKKEANEDVDEQEVFQKAKEESEKLFDEQYREKQISIPSTALKSIRYDPDTEGLTVQFTSSNKNYFYPAVPLELVQALLKASSKGEFFMSNIHDQYSMYGTNHGRKNKQQQKGIKNYMRSYIKNNKGRWSKK